MADKQYLANRLKYHTASRVANQTGDSLAATFNVDGHIVRDSSVWTAPLSAFPLQSNKKNADPIGATENLVEVFKTGATSVDFWNGGKVWTNAAYPAVKLYENVPMTPVAASLGQNMNSGTPTGTARYQAYEILAAADGVSTGELRVTEWVAPPAIVDPETGSPVAGYTGLQMLNGTALQKVSGVTSDSYWGLGGGHWEFVYMAGILTFEMGCTPEEIASNSTKGLTLTAFKYVGEKLDTTITNLEDKITGDFSADLSALETAISDETTARIAGDNALDTKMEAVKKYTVNGKEIQTNPVLTGADIKVDGYVKAGAQEAIAVTDTVNAALGKLEKKADDALAKAGTIEANYATKTYVDTQDAATLQSAKAYTDSEIDKLDGSAVIATEVNNIVTIKAGVSEVDGIVAQGEGADIVLAKVAKTGAAADVSVADIENVITADNVEDALAEIAKEIDAMDATTAEDQTAEDASAIAGVQVVTAVTQVDGKLTKIATAKADKFGSAKKALIDAKAYVDGKGYATVTYVDTQDAATLKDAKDYTNAEVKKVDDKFVNYYTSGQVDDKIAAAVTSAFKYMGVAGVEGEENYGDYTALPTEGLVTGHVYHVNTKDGKTVNAEYAWNGKAWEELGSVVDLSDYAKTAVVNAELAKKVDKTVYDAKVAELDETDADFESRITVAEAAIAALGKIENGEGIADALAKKVDKTVYDAKVTELESALSGKVASSDFNTFKGENTQAIADAQSDAEATAQAYTDAEIDKVKVVVSGKVASLDFESFKTSNTAAIAAAKSGAEATAQAYTDAEIDKVEVVVSGKVAQTEYDAFVEDIEQAVEDAETNATTAAKSYTDAEIDKVEVVVSGKVASSDFESFKTSNTAAIAAAKSEAITAAETYTNTEVGKKVDTTTFTTYKTANDKAVEDNTKAIATKADKTTAVLIDGNDNPTFPLIADTVYFVRKPFTGTLPTVENGELVTIKFVILEGGANRQVVAPQGVTINGEENKPCVLGVTADGLAISGDVITFMYVAGNWEVF